MNILFIGYWSISDNLTTTTILPHLNLLCAETRVKKVVFCTIERQAIEIAADPINDSKKIIHKPLFSRSLGNVFLTKIGDILLFTNKLSKFVKTYSINFVICRSAQAGMFGYLLKNKLSIPFIVESFEPHAQYMLESGVWSKFDPRFWLEKYIEQKVKKKSDGIVTVSQNFAKYLIDKGVKKSKVRVAPCSVDLSKFSYNPEQRQKVRAKLKINRNKIVGIYVGKFGGIYLEKEAFLLFKKAFEFYKGRFFLILLTNSDEDYVKENLKFADIESANVYCNFVSNNLVPDYLSAADFAFSTIKPGPSKKYCSPVKNGEYWANGLPIIQTEGIGDDAEIIIKENGGALFNLSPESMMDSLVSIDNILANEAYRGRISKIAQRYRLIENVKNSYNAFIFGKN